MVFSSIIFLFWFLPVVLLGYFVLPARLRNLFLTTISLIIYFWSETFLVWIIIASIITDYLSGLIISGGFRKGPIELVDSSIKKTVQQKLGLLLSLSVNLGLLGYFKYINFGIDNFNSFINSFGLSGLAINGFPQIALPLGISFYTFQTLSYSIDVYRGNVKATRNFTNFACFVAMFPQLVAGPIVRYKDISLQLIERKVNIAGFSAGVERFAIGLSKKVLIANPLGIVANSMFGTDVIQLSSLMAWMGVLAYYIQLYYDFSGYSDMAIGLGRMLGFKLPENFNYPYASRSVQEFWQRWHISLSSWLRDYLYFPLGGSKKGKFRTYINLFIVFVVCGFWHGSGWVFIVFGVIHGTFIVLERMIPKGLLERLPFLLRNLYTQAVFLFSLVLFEARDLSHAWSYYKALFGFASTDQMLKPIWQYLQPNIMISFVIGVIGAYGTLKYIKKLYADILENNQSLAIHLSLRSTLYAVQLTLLLLSVIGLSSNTYNPFIYFRF